MMSPVAAPWRLAICDDARWILGTGFLITPRFALTCAHVLPENHGDLWVQCGGTGTSPTRAHPSSLAETRPADVALLELDEPLEGITPAAPGPVEPPSAGTLLEAFGLPRKGRVREAASNGHQPDAGGAPKTPGAGVETGIWVPVRVNGEDLTGQRIQLSSRSPHAVPFQHGFSGGPVIEPQSDLVVGMLSHTQPAQPLSLMIPIRTLVDCSPVLRAILLPPTPADREFNEGLAALRSGNSPPRSLPSVRSVPGIRRTPMSGATSHSPPCAGSGRAPMRLATSRTSPGWWNRPPASPRPGPTCAPSGRSSRRTTIAPGAGVKAPPRSRNSAVRSLW